MMGFINIRHRIKTNMTIAKQLKKKDHRYVNDLLAGLKLPDNKKKIGSIQFFYKVIATCES